MLNDLGQQWSRMGMEKCTGRSGDIIYIWNYDVFTCSSAWHMNGALIVNGLWGSERTEYCIINVYAPCLVSEKLELWDRICLIINQYQSSCICVIGDFNSIRNGMERDGSGLQLNLRDMMAFNTFIHRSGHNDLPLHGRSFTWYKINGRCKSRIDRVLLNNHWMLRWPTYLLLSHLKLVLGQLKSPGPTLIPSALLSSIHHPKSPCPPHLIKVADNHHFMPDPTPLFNYLHRSTRKEETHLYATSSCLPLQDSSRAKLNFLRGHFAKSN
ncbi:hypothetical protein ACS0TY_007496 [Phlomoides rotata]